MNHDQALAFVRRHHRGVLATLKRDGRPQLSNVAYLLDDDGLVKISVTRDRAKVHNVRRDPHIALTALGDDWYEYVVVEGTAHLIEDDPLPLLRRLYRAVAGNEHPDWPQFDQAMVRDRLYALKT